MSDHDQKFILSLLVGGMIGVAIFVVGWPWLSALLNRYYDWVEKKTRRRL